MSPLLAALCASTPELQIPAGIRNVWLDIGTAGRSDFEPDVVANASLLVIGLEPTPKYAAAMRSKIDASAWGHRFRLVERACVGKGGPSSVEMYVHPLQECNSLLPSRDGHEPVHGGDCIGAKPTRTVVETTTLHGLLHNLLGASASPVQRVQLLKIDVQGFERPCLEGAGAMLHKVDNIFLEVQDQPPERSMYAAENVTMGLGDMDHFLARWHFERQYCELNSPGLTLRELNCLYTQRGSTPLWVTARPQIGVAHAAGKGGREHRRPAAVTSDLVAGLEHRPTVSTDVAAGPPKAWKGVEYVAAASLQTTTTAGALDAKLRALGRPFGAGDGAAAAERQPPSWLSRLLSFG